MTDDVGFEFKSNPIFGLGVSRPRWTSMAHTHGPHWPTTTSRLSGRTSGLILLPICDAMTRTSTLECIAEVITPTSPVQPTLSVHYRSPRENEVLPMARAVYALTDEDKDSSNALRGELLSCMIQRRISVRGAIC